MIFGLGIPGGGSEVPPLALNSSKNFKGKNVFGILRQPVLIKVDNMPYMWQGGILGV